MLIGAGFMCLKFSVFYVIASTLGLLVEVVGVVVVGGVVVCPL